MEQQDGQHKLRQHCGRVVGPHAAAASFWLVLWWALEWGLSGLSSSHGCSLGQGPQVRRGLATWSACLHCRAGLGFPSFLRAPVWLQQERQIPAHSSPSALGACELPARPAHLCGSLHKIIRAQGMLFHPSRNGLVFGGDALPCRLLTDNDKAEGRCRGHLGWSEGTF